MRRFKLFENASASGRLVVVTMTQMVVVVGSKRDIKKKSLVKADSSLLVGKVLESNIINLGTLPLTYVTDKVTK